MPRSASSWVKLLPLNEANAERIEIVRRHDADACRVAAVVVRQRHSLKVHRRDLQRCALFLEMREHAMLGVRFDVAVFRHPAERGEAGRMNAGSGLGDDAVSDREHRRIAADHQGNQDHGRGADRWSLRQDPASDAKILDQLFEPRRNPDRSRVLFRERDTAERAPGGGRCLCCRQAAFRLKPCLLSQMESDLVIHLPIRCGGKIQRPLNPHSKSAPPPHRRSPLRLDSQLERSRRARLVRAPSQWRPTRGSSVCARAPAVGARPP